MQICDRAELSAHARRLVDLEHGLFDGIDKESLSTKELCEVAVKRVMRSSICPKDQVRVNQSIPSID